MTSRHLPQRTPVAMTPAEVQVGASRIDADGYMLDEHNRPVYWDDDIDTDRAERGYLA